MAKLALRLALAVLAKSELKVALTRAVSSTFRTLRRLCLLMSEINSLHLHRRQAEDLIADYIELESSMHMLTRDMAQAHHVVASVCKLVALSERVEQDQGLARQLKRKFA